MSAAPNSARTPGRNWRRLILAIAAVVVGVCGTLFLSSSRDRERRGAAHRTDAGGSHLDENSAKGTYAEYSGSQSCKACHLAEYELWTRSHHALAERGPDPWLDENAFNPPRMVRYAAQTTAVRLTGGTYEIETAGLRTTQEVFGVERIIGDSPLRQFLVRFPGGRLQALDPAYDPRSNQWFSVFGAEERKPGDWGHWTGRGMNWNSMCAGCHNTRVGKNYHEADDSYQTTMVEPAVGCEACHGPLKAHVEWQRRPGVSRRSDPMLPKWPRALALDSCGFCHARRSELTGDFKPGDAFLDDLRPAIVDASEPFYADGQVRQEDYEYAPFLGSRMHQRGVQCVDCHNPHSAKTLLPGNWLCMRCHDGAYTNAPIVQPVAHSHHKVFGYTAEGMAISNNLAAYALAKVQETGGQCVNCHMPQTVYMERHWRHDHGFTIPDPQLTKQAGIPNACNRCHTDKDPDWALSYCTNWYGSNMNTTYRQRALLIAAARKGEAAARAGLLGMLATNEIPYWRAVAAGLLEAWAQDPSVSSALLEALNDSDALTRAASVRALEPLAAVPSVADALRRRLEDPVRGVRLAAAWALRSTLHLSSKAGKELLYFLAINADQPGGQMQRAAFAVARGDPQEALRRYHQAVEWDPNSGVIHHDYAVVLSGLNRPREAVEQLEAACRLEPTNADFQYKLALGWNELGQLEKAIASLQTAVKLEPGYSRAWYNLGLALNSTGGTEAALEALSRAEATDGSDPRAPCARATILARMGRLDEARRAAQRALEIAPSFEPARDLLENLR